MGLFKSIFASTVFKKYVIYQKLIVRKNGRVTLPCIYYTMPLNCYLIFEHLLQLQTKIFLKKQIYIYIHSIFFNNYLFGKLKYNNGKDK